MAAAMVLAFGCAACHRTFEQSVTQPNPLAEPNETLRLSEPVTIVTGDMDLIVPRYRGPRGNAAFVPERYPLTNMARFTVVSRDRLRFHVQIEHKWNEWTRLGGWDVVLIDDQGRRHRPDGIEQRDQRHIVEMWDQEQRSAVRDRFGDVVHVRRDRWRQRKPLGSLSVFRGRGDLVFHERDIFHSDVRWLTLVLRRGGITYEFTWRFTDDPELVGQRVAEP